MQKSAKATLEYENSKKKKQLDEKLDYDSDGPTEEEIVRNSNK